MCTEVYDEFFLVLFCLCLCFALLFLPPVAPSLHDASLVVVVGRSGELVNLVSVHVNLMFLEVNRTEPWIPNGQ